METRRHKLLILAKFLNQESKSQRFLMSFYVMSYSLMHVVFSTLLYLTAPRFPPPSDQ